MTGSIPRSISERLRSRQTFAISMIVILVQSNVSAAESDAIVSSHTGAIERIEQLEFPVGVEIAFTQTQLNPMLSKPVTQSGTLSIAADGAMTMVVTHPRWERRRLFNGYLELQRTTTSRRRHSPYQSTRRMKLNSQRPSHVALIAMTDLLRGDAHGLHERFTIEAVAPAIEEDGGQQPTVDEWRIALTPLEARVRNELQRLIIAGQQEHLCKFRVEQNDAWLDISIGDTAQVTPCG